MLICDESVSAVDVSIQAQLLNLLQDLQDQYGMSYIFISHDLAVVKYISDEVMVMKDGEIVELGNSDEVYLRPRHPYTQKLLASIPREPLPNTRMTRLGIHRRAKPRSPAGSRPRSPSSGGGTLLLLQLVPGCCRVPFRVGFRRARLRSVRRHQVPCRVPAFRVGQSERAQRGRSRSRSPAAHHELRQVQPLHAQRHAPPGLSSLLFETLLTGTFDEPTTSYGLLAEDVQVAPDRLSATFRINPAARFHNGKPVTAADVKHSFDTLMSKQAAPQYRVVFSEVSRAVVVAADTVRFEFKNPSAELPLLVGGGMPIFSREWGAGKPFDEVVMDTPIATGPYRVGRVNFGRDITYQRDPGYWARDLNVRRGMYNFDRVTYRIYKDTTAQTEAFKAGEFDYIQVFSARDWARVYIGKKFASGELIKRELDTRNAGDFQGYLINTRRSQFKDPRVREALALAFDFEWMNRQLMFNSYVRVRGFFNNSDFEAKGLPGPDELALLEPLRSKLPAKIFTEEVPLPPSTNPPGSLRDNLKRARDLLAEAGWTYRDGALRNKDGEPFILEYLDSGGGERTTTPYFQALARLGHPGCVPPGGFRAHPEAAGRLRFRSFHRARPGQRVARKRAARPLRIGIGRHRRLRQSHRSAGPRRRRAREPGRAGDDPTAAHCEPACARPCAAAWALCRAAVVCEHVSRRLPLGQIRAAASRAAVLSARGLGHLDVVDKEITPCGPTY